MGEKSVFFIKMAPGLAGRVASFSPVNCCSGASVLEQKAV